MHQEFFPRTCCAKHKKHDKREPGFFKEEFGCSELVSLCSKTCCRYNTTSDKWKFSSEGLNKQVLGQKGDGALEKNRKVLDDAVNLKQTNKQTEAFGQTITPLQRMSKLTEQYRISIQ